MEEKDFINVDCHHLHKFDHELYKNLVRFAPGAYAILLCSPLASFTQFSIVLA